MHTCKDLRSTDTTMEWHAEVFDASLTQTRFQHGVQCNKEVSPFFCYFELDTYQTRPNDNNTTRRTRPSHGHNIFVTTHNLNLVINNLASDHTVRLTPTPTPLSHSHQKVQIMVFFHFLPLFLWCFSCFHCWVSYYLEFLPFFIAIKSLGFYSCELGTWGFDKFSSFFFVMGRKVVLV